MKKYLLSLLTLVSISASAQEFTDGDFKFNVLDENSVEITGFANSNNSATTLVVPSTATDGTKTYNVTAVGKSAFTASYSSGLTEVTIPSSVKRIEASAFFGSTSKFWLKTLNLSEGLEYIGQSAFYGNGIENLVIPASVDSIGNSAFIYSPKMKTITFNEGLTFIGNGAFASGTWAYNTNNVLTSVTLPSTLKHLGDEAFLNNAALASINIPKSLETLGESVIAGTVVSTLTVDEGCENFQKVGDVVYNSDKTLLCIAPIKGITSLTVPEGTLGINGGAFWDSDIEEITLPEGLLAIGYGAFENSQLKSINFPKSLVFIDEQAFAQTKLTEVTLPENAPYVNDAEFYGCTLLTKVVFPSSIKEIYNHAFTGCTNLKNIVCHSATAPVIMDYYEDYDHPFNGFSSSTTTITVPAGAKASYQSEGFGDYMKIVEDSKGTILPETIVPADKSELYAEGNEMVYKFTFDQDVTLTSTTPDVHIRVGYNWSTVQIAPEGGWTAALDGRTLTITGSNESGNVAKYNSEEGLEYHIIVPEGLGTNAADEKSEWIDLTLIGTSNVNAIDNIHSDGITTVNDGTDSPAYNIAGQRVSPNTKGIVIQNGKKRINK